MTMCVDCAKEMKNVKTKTCVLKLISINGKKFERDTDFFDIGKRCHDCNIVNKKGNVHHYGCDMERCPKCKGQLISCGCKKGKVY